MPDQASQATFQRRTLVLEAIKQLSHGGSWVEQVEIVKHLNGQGYAVEKHQVRRDLKALAESYTQLECNDNSRDGEPKKGLAYGYRWVGRDAPPETGLSIPEALSLVLVERYLRDALPATLTRALQAIFERARHTLDLQKKSPEAQWADKVAVVQPTQPLLPPTIPNDVLNVVHEALLKGEQIKVHYRNASNKGEDLTLHPLGLIQRGPATYLVALCFRYEDPRLYSLHRVVSAVRLYRAARAPANFKVSTYADEQGHFGTGHLITLKARVCSELGMILEETKLHSDQVLSRADASGWRSLTARVRDTWQLHWWLLSQGGRMEVTGPEQLRKRISGTLQRASAQYCDAAKTRPRTPR